MPLVRTVSLSLGDGYQRVVVVPCCITMYLLLILSLSPWHPVVPSSHQYCISTSDILATMRIRHCGFNQNTVSVVPHLFYFHPASTPPPSPPSCISAASIPVVLYLHRCACQTPYSPLPLSAITIITHLHRLCRHPIASLFQTYSNCLLSSCIFHHHLYLFSCVSAVYPLPPFI